MTKEEIQNLTLRVGEQVKGWLDAENVKGHYILILVERVGGELSTALTSSNPNPRAVATMLTTMGEDILSPDPQTDIQFLPPPRADG